jgi:hypothetical protein
MSCVATLAKIETANEAFVGMLKDTAGDFNNLLVALPSEFDG